MSKRKRSDGSLTGGTGDVSPQWMSFSVTQSAADTTTTATQAIPVQRMPSSTKAQVMEVLKVLFDMPAFPANASAAEAVDTMQVMLSTSSFGTTATTLAEPRVFAGWRWYSRGAFTAAGTYVYVAPQTVILDLTDNAGHGVLVATDNVFLQAGSGGTGAANQMICKILYRWKNVSLSEYIGIVQSQQ